MKRYNVHKTTTCHIEKKNIDTRITAVNPDNELNKVKARKILSFDEFLLLIKLFFVQFFLAITYFAIFQESTAF